MDELRPCLLMRSLEGTGKRLIVTSDAHVLGETGATPGTTKPYAPALHAAIDGSREWNRRYWGRGECITGGSASCASVRVIFSQPVANSLAASCPAAPTWHVIEPGTNCGSAVHSDDLADLYSLALHKAGAGTLIHAASEMFSMKELAGAIHRGMGKSGEASGISLEDAQRILPYAATLCGNMAVSGEMARRTLGWKPAGPSYLGEVEQEVRAPRIFKGSRSRRG